MNEMRRPMRWLAAAIFSMHLTSPVLAQSWTIDPSHTVIGFEVDHFGMSTMIGRFDVFEGDMVIDTDAPEEASVSFTIDIASMDTGHEGRDAHFAAPDFFDAATYPTARFVSRDVTVTSDTTADVTGDLTIKDVTQPITLAVVLNGLMDDHPIQPGTQRYVGFTATGSFPRADFGIDKYSGVGDIVTLRIELEASADGS